MRLILWSRPCWTCPAWSVLCSPSMAMARCMGLMRRETPCSGAGLVIINPGHRFSCWTNALCGCTSRTGILRTWGFRMTVRTSSMCSPTCSRQRTAVPGLWVRMPNGRRTRTGVSGLKAPPLGREILIRRCSTFPRWHPRCWKFLFRGHCMRLTGTGTRWLHMVLRMTKWCWTSVSRDSDVTGELHSGTSGFTSSRSSTRSPMC